MSGLALASSIQCDDAGRYQPLSKGYLPMIIVEAMREGDWPAVRRIYAEGLRTGLAAFAASAPSWETWDRAHVQTGRLVARDGEGRVVAWAALTPVPDT